MEILRWFYAARSEITGRALAKRIGFSHQQALNALRQLIAFGIVERRVIGASYVFRLADTELARKVETRVKDCRI